jgi:hypothetical protein
VFVLINLQDTLKLKASAPISETRHEKKLHIPVQFSIEKLDSKSEFDLEDVDKWINGLIQSLSIEVMKKEKTDKEILIQFRYEVLHKFRVLFGCLYFFVIFLK